MDGWHGMGWMDDMGWDGRMGVEGWTVVKFEAEKGKIEPYDRREYKKWYRCCDDIVT